LTRDKLEAAISALLDKASLADIPRAATIDPSTGKSSELFA
jgi:hypothetical protein